MVTMNDLTTSLMITTMNASSTTELPKYIPPYWDLPAVIILSTLLALITLACIVGNSMVIFVIIYFKGMHTKTNMFIMNLAVADFGVACICMPFSLLTVVNGDWKFGYELCNMNAFFIAFFLIASIHGLMYISIHKYFSIVKPLARLITQRKALLMILASWGAAFIGAVGAVVGWTSNEYKPATAQCGPKFPENYIEKSHAYFILTVGYLIPLIVLCYNYSVIFWTIKKYSERLKRHSNYDEERILTQQKEITKTLFIVFIAFFICWTPYFVFAGMGTVVGFDNIPRWPNILVYWCGYASSAINPIIYAFRTKSYRRAFMKLCCCIVEGGFSSEHGSIRYHDSSPSALRRFNTSLSENSRIRSPSMNSTYMTTSPSLTNRYLIESNSRDQMMVPSANIAVVAEIVDYKPVQVATVINGRIVDQNGNHGNHVEDDDVFDENGQVPQPNQNLGGKKVKRSVSESDKEGLEERHYGPIRKHSGLTVCLSAPLEKIETVGDTKL